MTNELPDLCSNCGCELWPCDEINYPEALQQAILRLSITEPWLCKACETSERNENQC
jgi:hypothetical protein